MRLVRYRHQGHEGVGIETEAGVAPTRFDDMIELIESGETPEPTGDPLTPERILAPIARPRKIFGSGVNFRSHQEENPEAVLPTQPGFFSKLPSSVVGTGDAIVVPTPEQLVDYEVEVVIVVGAAARRVPRERALEHVFGYSVVNDVSARDLQFAGDIVLGKGLDTFCPLGPAIVTVDELGDASDLELATYVNGEQLQHGNTDDWLFDVGTIVEFLSSYVTLEAGDVITTGTPAGVAAFRDPPPYLRPGDEVTVEVSRIGRLTNPVVAGW
jgi:2-keto-4-pentenoate hydratase/2-oxohepta-3-ene-1,7-dioic acid hydratase in catechol pathway